jgi:hypothetical protein
MDEAYWEQIERVKSTFATLMAAMQQTAEVIQAFYRCLAETVSQSLMLTLSEDDYELAMRRYANLLNRSRFCRQKVSWRRLNRVRRQEAVLAWFYDGS